MLLVLGIVCLFAIFSSNLKAQPQIRDRIIHKKRDFNPPADISLIKTKIGKILPNKELRANEDWFEDLAIIVTNTYDKPINHISLSIRFPRQDPPEKRKKERKLDFVIPLNYGESPIPRIDGSVRKNTATPILPGQSIELTLSKKEYSEIRRNLRESNFPPNIDVIDVYITTIGFTDGTVWLGGKILKFNNSQQGSITPIKKWDLSSVIPNNIFVKSEFNWKDNLFDSFARTNRLYEEASCGSEIQDAHSMDCGPALPFHGCEVTDVSVGGIDGGLTTELVERQCRPIYNSDDWCGRKETREIATCRPEITLHASPTQTLSYREVTVNWTATRPTNTYDKIQLNEDLESSFYNHGKQYLSGGTSGTMVFKMPGPGLGDDPEKYEFRYITSDGAWLATSETIYVTKANPPTPTPDPGGGGGGGECPCGDCQYGCEGPDLFCHMEEILGQCWEVCTTYENYWEEENPYDGTIIIHTDSYTECETQCDPSQWVEICTP